MGVASDVPRFRPRSQAEVEEILRDCLARNISLEVVGAGTKRALGRMMHATHVLDLSELSGIVSYEPEELVLTAKAGTPLVEIEDALAARNQVLAFEPADLGPLWRNRAGAGTLGGILATNSSGPRRIKAGAARDHILGVSAVSGRAESFKAGGKVVKNVTGYDLPKLFAGSFGTLAAMTEITVKLAPSPEMETTLLIRGLDDAGAIRAMTAALQSPCDVSGAAHLANESSTALRLEGFGPSVADRARHLEAALATFGPIELISRAESQTLWQRVRDVADLTKDSDTLIWRLSIPPSSGARAVERIKGDIGDIHVIYDWGGGLIWIGVRGPDPHTDLIRPASAREQGHATLIRAPEALRHDVFTPLPTPLKDLTLRVKEQFDPKRLLNPGRMYPWA